MFFKHVPLLVLMVFDTNLGKPKNLSVIDFDTISTLTLSLLLWNERLQHERKKQGMNKHYKKNTALTRKEI
jgi:hypothetical protein